MEGIFCSLETEWEFLKWVFYPRDELRLTPDEREYVAFDWMLG